MYVCYHCFVEYHLLVAQPSFDVWSLGCILYQMCSPDVRPLFQGTDYPPLYCPPCITPLFFTFLVLPLLCYPLVLPPFVIPHYISLLVLPFSLRRISTLYCSLHPFLTSLFLFPVLSLSLLLYLSSSFSLPLFLSSSLPHFLSSSSSSSSSLPLPLPLLLVSRWTGRQPPGRPSDR